MVNNRLKISNIEYGQFLRGLYRKLIFLKKFPLLLWIWQIFIKYAFLWTSEGSVLSTRKAFSLKNITWHLYRLRSGWCWPIRDLDRDLWTNERPGPGQHCVTLCALKAAQATARGCLAHCRLIITSLQSTGPRTAAVKCCMYAVLAVYQPTRVPIS